MSFQFCEHLPVLGLVLSTLNVLSHFILTVIPDHGSATVPTAQIRQLGLREILLIASHTSEGWSQNCWELYLGNGMRLVQNVGLGGHLETPLTFVLPPYEWGWAWRQDLDYEL